MLRQRLVTGIVLVVVLLSGLYAGSSHVFGVGLAVFYAVGFSEWVRLCRDAAAGLRWLASGVWSATLLALVFLRDPSTMASVAWLGGAWWLMLLGVVLAYPRVSGVAGWPWSAGVVAGVMTLFPSWFILVLLHSLDTDGTTVIVLIFALIIASDSGAYFAGRRFGRRKLAPKISPGKTIEGVMGGVLLANLVGALCVSLLLDQVLSVGWFVVFTVTSLASVLGDLYESLSKRAKGVKDSGAILPGHGGVLDRLDSISAAVPVFAATVAMTGVAPWFQ